MVLHGALCGFRLGEARHPGPLSPLFSTSSTLSTSIDKFSTYEKNCVRDVQVAVTQTPTKGNEKTPARDRIHIMVRDRTNGGTAKRKMRMYSNHTLHAVCGHQICGIHGRKREKETRHPMPPWGEGFCGLTVTWRHIVFGIRCKGDWTKVLQSCMRAVRMSA